MDIECEHCGHVGDVKPGVPYPSILTCPDCGGLFREDWQASQPRMFWRWLCACGVGGAADTPEGVDEQADRHEAVCGRVISMQTTGTPGHWRGGQVQLSDTSTGACRP